MGTAFNVFEPGDLELAQYVLDDVWTSLPSDVRSGPRGIELRDWLAKQVLSSIKTGNAEFECVATRLKETDLSAWL